MRIPVFVSCPTELNSHQEAARLLIIKELRLLHLEARALGRTDYPKEYPLREVLVMGLHCSGAVILGFTQFEASGGVWKRGTAEEKVVTDPIHLPTPWNQLEAGILFTLGLPLLIFREQGITGGVFDPGVTDVFVHRMPVDPLSRDKQEELREVILSWQAAVRARYYRHEPMVLGGR